jgi:hypothetical protein
MGFAVAVRRSPHRVSREGVGRRRWVDRIHFDGRHRIRRHGAPVGGSWRRRCPTCATISSVVRAWLERGEPVLDATLSPVLADHVRWGTGGMEWHVLPHAYAGLLSSSAPRSAEVWWKRHGKRPAGSLFHWLPDDCGPLGLQLRRHVTVDLRALNAGVRSLYWRSTAAARRTRAACLAARNTCSGTADRT